METIAERLKYWSREVEAAQTALDYAIGQRALILEAIVAEHVMEYSDPLTHVKDLDKLYGAD